MRYTTWTSRVFHALEHAVGSAYRGVGLGSIGEGLGVPGLTYDDFVKREDMPAALMRAMEDLTALGLVEFPNVGYGCNLTPEGRDVAGEGLSSTWPDIAEIRLTEAERSFLARLYVAAARHEADWANVAFVDADPVYRVLGLEATDAYATTIQRLTFLGDLTRKGLVKAESRTLGAPNNYRPTYLAAVLVTEPDVRDRGLASGLIDWAVPTTGFEDIAERLADLKVRLAGAITDDDLSDVGRRCRDIAADAVDVVFRAEMVPAGSVAPSRQDAGERLALYLEARAGGRSYSELRGFLKASLKLANARTHSARTGRAAAVASAQGLLSFVRALEAIERSPALRDTNERPGEV